MLSDFRAWFDCSDHADVLLHLCIESQPASENPQPADISNSRKRPRNSTGPTASAVDSSAQQADKALQQVQQARVFSLHAVLLARHSAWFKAALSKPWQQPACTTQRNDMISCSPASAIRHGLSMHVQPDEVEAADLLLRLIYGYDPPALSKDNLPLFFTCLRLADRFDSPDCVDLLLGHIKDIIIDISMVWHVYCAPPGVQNHPTHKHLKDSCKHAVLQMYGRVPSVIRDKQLLREFCSLPFVAVLAWAESDKLQVQSENCVVYLLSAWVKAAQREGGQGVSNEQLEQLAHQVRVLHLGPAYLHHVLPQLRWFKGCSCMEWLPLALSCWQACDRSAVKACSGRPKRSVWKGPKQWVAKPRSQYAMTDEDTELRLEVGSKKLQRLYNMTVGQFLRSTTTLYFNGFHMCLCIKPVKSAGGAEGITLGLSSRMCKSQLAGAISWPNMAGVIVGPIRLTMMGTEADLRPRPMVGTSAQGCPNMLGQSAPTMRELLAPLLREGKLHVKARFSHVDRGPMPLPRRGDRDEAVQLPMALA